MISRRWDELGTDVFRTRLLLQPAICLRGADAARLFYGSGRFSREEAFPASILHLLQDEGSVQSLTGPLHRHRKQIFLGLLQGPGSEQISDVLARH